MTAEICRDLQRYLAPKGVIVVSTAQHLCMKLRGWRSRTVPPPLRRLQECLMTITVFAKSSTEPLTIIDRWRFLSGNK